MQIVETLEVFLRDLAHEAKPKRIANVIYEHMYTFGHLNFSKYHLATSAAQLYVWNGIGKALYPLGYYDPNIVTSTKDMGKSRQLSCSLGSIFQRQLDRVLSTALKTGFSVFWFSNRDHTQTEYASIDKNRLLTITLLKVGNTIHIQVTFAPCSVYPGLLYDLSMVDVMLHIIRERLDSVPGQPYKIANVLFNFLQLISSGKGFFNAQENDVGFIKPLNNHEAIELFRLENSIRGYRLTTMPNPLIPLSEAGLNYLQQVIKFWQNYDAGGRDGG